MSDLSGEQIQSIVDSCCAHIFDLLGPHALSDGRVVVRAYLPDADAVDLLKDGIDPVVMERLHDQGLFQVTLPSKPEGYRLRARYGEHQIDVDDPYRFHSTISDQDLYLFGEGTHERVFDCLGAHLMQVDGIQGCRFAVWAPNAYRVSVVGDFNFWDGRKHMMRKLQPSGIWEIFIPGVAAGNMYKYEIKAEDGQLLPHKADPYGFASQSPPEQASIVHERYSYQWQDDGWEEQRKKKTKPDCAASVYEVHLGSWKRVPEEGNRYLTYRELAKELIPYVVDMGFTHIQVLPLCEYPFDGSWGYQPIGMYAPTQRFGSPDDFKYFVDQCHQHNIAVIMDWVPGHFPTDDHGLGLFDGTPLYEHGDYRLGFHPDWNTYIYDYGRKEVCNYLMASAIFWLHEYHLDGLRVDAVASMLYLDYSRKEGEWLPNAFGGRENLEAIDFIRLTNERVYKNFPDAMMIAEESTSWPGVSKPTNYGGLGFGYKWNMGWMNDSLSYMSKDPIHRKFHHNDMTFSLYYAFSENFILPLSHDEVVHGKGSLLEKMPGDPWQKFANLRAYFAFMWAHPGKKLLFMGNEFAQGPEWDHDNSLSWHELDVAEHSGVQAIVRDLNTFYAATPALFERDVEDSGFEWVEADDSHNSVFSFLRKTDTQQILVVVNFTPMPREQYRIGVNQSGRYVEKINTDAVRYGGSGMENVEGIYAEEIPWHYRHYSIVMDIPPLSAIYLEVESN